MRARTDLPSGRTISRPPTIRYNMIHQRRATMRFPLSRDSSSAWPRAGRLGRDRARPGLNAQYYGRNKVQYQKFDFKIMKTRHFDIYFYLQDEQTVKMAGLMAERWYSRLSRMFNHELKGRQPLILYGSSPEFQQTTVIPELIGEGTGGVTESFKRRIVLPYGASLAETDHVIGHELVHAFQYDIMAQGHSDAGPGQRLRPAHPPLVHRGHGRVPVHRPGRPQHGDVDAGRRPPQGPARRSRSSTTPTSTSPTAGARPFGPTSRAAGGTRSSAR